MANRVDLLPPMLEANQMWIDFANAIEIVWGGLGIPQAITQLKTLRQPMVVSDAAVSDALSAGTLINLANVNVLERDALVRTADLLGFSYAQTDALTDTNYLLLCRNLAFYYNQVKGMSQWTDFITYTLNAPFSVSNTWTQDYVTFYAEGDPAIGTPVYAGGSWYPTTHIILNISQAQWLGLSLDKLLELVYNLGNIQLVVYYISVTDESLITETVGISSVTTITY